MKEASLLTALFDKNFGQAMLLIVVGIGTFCLPELIEVIGGHLPAIKSVALCGLGGALAGTGIVAMCRKQ